MQILIALYADEFPPAPSRKSGALAAFSGEDVPNHMAVNIRKPAVNSVVANGQLLMVDTQEMQNRRMDVINLRRVGAVKRLVAPLVARPVAHPPLDPPAAEPVAENIGVVVAPLAPLGARHAPELCGPENDRVVEEASAAQVLDQPRRAGSHAH